MKTKLLIITPDEFITSLLEKYQEDNCLKMQIVTNVNSPLLDYRLQFLNQCEVYDFVVILLKNRSGNCKNSPLESYSDKENFRTLLISRRDAGDNNISVQFNGEYNFFTNPPIAVKQFISSILNLIKESNFQQPEIQNVRGLFAINALQGQSQVMKDLRILIKKVSRFSGVPVLITGETGTGKELVANALHYLSPRSKNSIKKLNCSAIPETLIESQLFGHRKGAFTGAASAQKGMVELANKGTLFLDEISEMRAELQSKLLRFLEDGSYLSVGDSKECKSDAWAITATNRNLKELMDKNLFRNDLFYRLNTVEIKIPPLRKRKEDILPLVQNFIKEFSIEFAVKPKKLSAESKDILMDYHWPGNVRELRNVLRGAMVKTDGKTLQPHCFDWELGKMLTLPGKSEKTIKSLKEIEQQHIIFTFKNCQYKIRKTANVLGIDRNTLKKKLKQYGIETTQLVIN
jgi:DNA-binding NtrC family response regulator